MKRILLPVIIIAAIVQGCVIGGKYSPQQKYTDTTFVYPHTTTQDSLQLIKWTELYHDSELTYLISLALDSNRNMLTAVARVEEARERAGIVKSDLWPSFNYSGGVGASSFGGGSFDISGYSVSAGMFWEVDLLGRLRHLNRASKALYLSEVENQLALQVSIVGQTAELYFILRDLDNRLFIAKRTLDSRRENTRLITARFNEGYVPELDKLQAEQQEAVVEASIYDLERLIGETENALQVLTGNLPGTIYRGLSIEEQVLTDIPAGLPSQLLQRRPDIRSAERQIEAQFNFVGAAKAEMFPIISLTGVLGYASPQLSSLISSDNLYATGNGSITGPLFEFSKKRHRKKAEEYRLQELTYQYEHTVLRAFSEVDNALYGYRSYNKQLEVLNKQVEAATKALRLTNARYEFGYTSYLEVIIQEDNLFNAELQRSFVLQKKLNSVVNLYRSLGGGW